MCRTTYCHSKLACARWDRDEERVTCDPLLVRVRLQVPCDISQSVVARQARADRQVWRENIGNMQENESRPDHSVEAGLP